MKKILLLVALSLYAMAGTAFAIAYSDYQNDRPGVIISGGDDPSLQSILDSNTDAGLDAMLDQNATGGWIADEGAVDAYAVNFVAGHAGKLFLFSLSDPSVSQEIFDSNSGSVSTSFRINGSGDLIVNNVLAKEGFGSSFGFYWFDSVDESESYTYDYFNPDYQAMALAYLVPDGTALTGDLGHMFSTGAKAEGNNDWILAFNDGFEDSDFNDAVFYVEDIVPTPEPGTLLLLGSGLAGLAAAKRRKKS